MKLISSSKYFSALPVRDFLNQIKYKIENDDLLITLSLIFGTNEKTLEARKKSYLTHSTEMVHQIRFPLKDRVLRSIEKLSYDVQKRYPLLEKFDVRVCEDDFISIAFFKNIHAAHLLYSEPLNSISNFLTEEEKLIEEGLSQSRYQMQVLIDKSQERIYSGDYRTAYKVLSEIPDCLKNERIYYMLGLCTNFFGRIDESEKYFQKILNSHDPLSVVTASYVMAMLFLRMHKKDKQDLLKAEKLLQNAYLVLQNNPDIKDHNFQSVFNRNGYALCLFRRGHVQEALKMLQQGIAKIDQGRTGANNLHKSVLIYNSVQCLRALRRYNECEEMCQMLLQIDPLFPEYHLEYARSLFEQNKYLEAIRSLRKAIDLDSFIPESYALLGYSQLNLGLYELAAHSYQKAFQMKPSEFQWALDQAYCLSEARRWVELEAVLKAIPIQNLTIEQLENFNALSTEVREVICET